jgi:hypothetical protein
MRVYAVRQPTVTLSCRVSPDQIDAIDAVIAEMGQSRAEWLYALVHRELTGQSLETVRGLCDRVAAVELKLAKVFR